MIHGVGCVIFDCEDDHWISRLQEQSPERETAITELRNLLVRGLTGFLKHRPGGLLIVEDTAQEATLKILNSIHKYEGRSRFTTWAMTVATRIAISSFRRKHFQDVSLEGISADQCLKIQVAIDETCSVEKEHDRKLILQKLGQLIDTLLSDRQKIAVRALLEGLPVEEIALRTESNRNAVYKLIHDARMKLREGFEQAGIFADDLQIFLT